MADGGLTSRSGGRNGIGGGGKPLARSQMACARTGDLGPVKRIAANGAKPNNQKVEQHWDYRMGSKGKQP